MSKAVTANRLADGRVVYWTRGGHWAERLADAAFFSDAAEADEAATRARARITEVADAYLIEADASGAAGRAALRETIRASGPTTQPDVGKQAGNP